MESSKFLLKNEDCLEFISSLENDYLDCVFTSPPYFAGKEYEDSVKTKDGYEKYIQFLLEVFVKLFRCIKPGGHLWINIDDVHTSLKSEFKKSITLPTHAILLAELSKLYDYKDLVLWRKIRSKHASGGANRLLGSYGRFGSPGSIPIVGEVEFILWFKKPGSRTDVTDEMRKESALTPQEFINYGMQIWEIQPERASKIGHPAPFPIELAERVIKLSTFKGDIVYDPFVGSGTTIIACLRTGRFGIGTEISPKYYELAINRIRKELNNE